MPEGQCYLTVVDITRVHFWNVNYCGCSFAAPEHFQLLQAQLLPASTKDPRTVFTFRVLDDFLRDNVECGTSAMNYFSKLRCITSNAFPHLVPVGDQDIRFVHVNLAPSLQDRYRELMRVARQWRLMKTLKWRGYGVGDASPSQGELALFCPACPQPGVNIPITSELDLSDWKYTRSVVMDGNFKAEHMHGRSQDDVSLMDGLAFMVTRLPYKEFISTTNYPPEVRVPTVGSSG